VALVLFAIQVVVLAFFLLVFQLVPDWQAMVLLPLALVTLIIFTSAVSIFLSAANVYLRDTQHLTEVLLMAWFWGTPIVYPYGQVQQHLANWHLTWLYLSNPIAPIAMSFQRAIYGQTSYVAPLNNPAHVSTPLLPTVPLTQYAALLGIMLVVSIGLFLLSLIVFGRLEGNFAEEL
jgi:ABC-2 type transport system permease protein